MHKKKPLIIKGGRIQLFYKRIAKGLGIEYRNASKYMKRENRESFKLYELYLLEDIGITRDMVMGNMYNGKSLSLRKIEGLLGSSDTHRRQDVFKVLKALANLLEFLSIKTVGVSTTIPRF